MRERPEGLQLLQTTATVLREQLLPAIAEEHRYLVLMAINAISIAGRQLKADERMPDQARQLLRAALSPLERPLARLQHDGAGMPAEEQLARLAREFALRVRF